MVPRLEAADVSENLRKIKHIVVLVLENRSFDHMLGFLSLPTDKGGRDRRDVDGLKGNEFNKGPSGKKFSVFPLPTTIFPLDPAHSAGQVQVQMGGVHDPPMGGFVRSFITKQENERVDVDDGLIMGYYTRQQLPVFDLLAENFVVCDRWFSSMPGPTWPNRMFLYGGTSNNIINNEKPPIASDYKKQMPKRLIAHLLNDCGVDWRIYSHGFAWMRFFPTFDPGFIPGLSSHVDKFDKFLKACERGTLPAVSFIDPEWSDFGPPKFDSDDQPPADVAGGQRLVAEIYVALRTNGLLGSTLYVITYDEHGGFYDHVSPPDAPDFRESQREVFKRYGVRVPAIVVSGLAPARFCSSTTFDHTSILKTILLCFCERNGKIPFMTPRVSRANDLGELLTGRTARTRFPSAARHVSTLVKSLDSRKDLGMAVQRRPHDLAMAVIAGRALALASGVPEEHL